MKMTLFLAMTMLAIGAPAEETGPAGEVVFRDDFAKGPADAWEWLRENPDDWRASGEGLEIRNRPGDAQTVRNALLLPVPETGPGVLTFELTVSFTGELTEQYEQAGLTWYADKAPVLKLVHELIDKEYFIIPGRVETDKKVVRLRLIVENGRYRAQFKQEGEEDFRTVAEDTLPSGTVNHISIQCYHGPANADHWVRFSDFVITHKASCENPS